MSAVLICQLLNFHHFSAAVSSPYAGELLTICDICLLISGISGGNYVKACGQPAVLYWWVTVLSVAKNKSSRINIFLPELIH